MKTAIVIGASTGIGLAICRRLVDGGWAVTGLSRRAAGFEADRYRHVVADVRAENYRDVLTAALDHGLASAADPGPPDLCVYAAGIGHELDLADPSHEAEVFATNLTGAVITAEVVIPRMIAAHRGHLIGLSSQADRLIDRHAPSYAASKAGLSSYLEGLGLACRPHGVAITNVRFGFVDTAMSRGQPRPFLITAERAAQIVERCIARRPIRKTYPLRMAAVLWWFRWISRLRVWAS